MTTTFVANDPVTADLPAAGSAAGNLAIAISAASIEHVNIRVDVPFKWIWAATAAAAVTAFSTVATHGRLPAGIYQLSARGHKGDSLYLEATSSDAVTTNGVTYQTEFAR